ncbi:hypothetical protein MMC10_003849 [Thelotrema lepadinum]|nr:hypothetical protein [Thelotrema lepadinum]
MGESLLLIGILSELGPSPIVSTSAMLPAILGHILDKIIIKRIFANTPALPTHQMHLLRTAAVNADFLTYLALAHKISVPVTNVVPPAKPPSPFSHPRKHRKSPDATVEYPSPEISRGEVDMDLLSLLRREPSADLSTTLSATTRRFETLKSSISSALEAGDTYS